MQRFEARKAIAEAISKSDLAAADKLKLQVALTLFPRKRRAILDAVEEQLVFCSLVEETESGLVYNAGPDGTYGSAWLLIIQALIAFLPMLLELLNR